MTHILRWPIVPRRAAFAAVGTMLVFLLAGCDGTSLAQTLSSAPTAAPPTSAPTAAVLPTSAPTDAVLPTSAPTDAADTSTLDALKTVIQRANQEQQQAVAAHDPTLMRDTATSTYYSQSIQNLNDLVSGGVTAIQLVNLDWGPTTLQGTDTAQSTTVETWRTTFADGSTLQETDTNVYTLVLESGAWKVQDDQHPDSRRLQPAQDTPGASPAPAAPVAPDTTEQSRNWAGYTATGGTFTEVSGTWTVPTVSAGRASAADATWVGIGGINTRDLIQAGTDATAQSGQVSYTAWIETLPQMAQPVPLTVHAGDTVSVTIAQQSSGQWQINIHNTTTGGSYQKSVTYNSSGTSAEWIEESPAVGRRLLLPLDNFGTVSFTGATTVKDGQQRTIAEANGHAITMISQAGQPLVQPSALGADGSSFTATRTNVPAPRIAPGATNG